MKLISNTAELNQLILILNPNKIFFLVDENTHEHCLPLLLADLPDLGEYEILEIEPGEENKSLEVAANLWLSLAELGTERNDVLINVGGGVVTDLGGFVAATYKRGMPFINVPTSLLAMVDAAHGGKTGIDLANAKNLIGLIVNANAVYSQASFLETLPKNQLKSGFAEMLKHGLIADAQHWENALESFPTITEELINRSAEIKLEIVAQDPTEKGKRKLLNFGHTLGHAIESYLLENERPILHGEAVAAGVIIEADLSRNFAQLSNNDFVEIEKKIDSIFSRISLQSTEIDEILAWLKFDKKNKGGKNKFTLLNSIGSAVYDVEIGLDDVKLGLQNYLA